MLDVVLIKLKMIKLIWITPDAENLLTYIARVSNPKNQQKQLESETPDQMNARLLRYLINNKHWSPFEMVNACFEINTSRAISAQIIRHRSFAFQEFSQRYASVTELSEFHYPEIRYVGTTNRQKSLEFADTQVSAMVHSLMELKIREGVDSAFETYQYLLDCGVAPESARMVLPMCSPTRLYMNGTVRSWIHYLQIRNDESHVQKEHFQIAQSIESILSKELPLTWQALNGVQ